MESLFRSAELAKTSAARWLDPARHGFQMLTDKIKSMNLWNLLWIAIALSEIFTVIMNVIMGYLWWGRINDDLLMIGAVDGFIVALLVTIICLAFTAEIRRQEKRAGKALFENELVYSRRIEASLREKETLLRELYHRTKNNMQVISSLIGLQTVSITDERVMGLLRDIQNRIRAMSLIHEQLYKSRDLASLDIKDYIEVLANVLLLSYQKQAGKVGLAIDIDSIPLSIDLVMPCGLILNELISNSLKYAFPGDRNGKISISLHRAGSGVEFVYSDDGIGLKEADIKAVDTLGLRLVKNLATKQLGGKVEVRTGNGTEFHIAFPEEA